MTGHEHPAHDHAAHDHAATATAAPDLAAQLRARGLRMTAQREHVLHAVRDLGHATPEQIADATPEVDVTTVYRTLELLEELGLVKHAHLGHGAPSYRPADDDHIHVVCHVCGHIDDAPAGLVGPLAERLHADSGFVVDQSHLTVFGRCRECADHGATEQTRDATRS